MANVLGICIGVGLLVLMVAAFIIAYWRLIAYRRNLRRRYGRRAGQEPPCCCYDALPMCFADPLEMDSDGRCQPCECFMKYEPDPDAPPAAAYMTKKKEAGEDTSRVPEIGNQPPPTYDVTKTDDEVTKRDDDVTKDDGEPPAYDETVPLTEKPEKGAEDKVDGENDPNV